MVSKPSWLYRFPKSAAGPKRQGFSFDLLPFLVLNCFPDVHETVCRPLLVQLFLKDIIKFRFFPSFSPNNSHSSPHGNRKLLPGKSSLTLCRRESPRHGTAGDPSLELHGRQSSNSSRRVGACVQACLKDQVRTAKASQVFPDGTHQRGIFRLSTTVQSALPILLLIQGS